MAKDPIVGIDLGTSNSAVAFCDVTGTPRVLVDSSGNKIQPSVVSFHPNGSVVIGAEAKQRKVLDPRNTVFSAKRLIGRTFRSPQVQTAIGRMPYQIKEGQNQQPVIATRAGEFSVPEISAIVLDHLHTIANTALRTTVTRAVITVPANFTDAQRSATATAGAIAGLTVVRVLNEPTAAALAYGHQRRLSQTIAVYDFGGGTFDVTILKLTDQVFEVLGTAGDSFLGGDDLDERVVDKLVASFLETNRIDLNDNEIAMMRLRAVAEQTKIELSRRQKAMIRVDELAYGPGGVAIHMNHELSRQELVLGVSDIIDRTFPVCDEALRVAGIKATQIDDVVMVGGVTKMPYVRDRVAEYFGRLPRIDVNPEEAVAVGAALQAASLERVLSGRPMTVPPMSMAAQSDPDAGRIHRTPSASVDFADEPTTHVGPRAGTAPLPAASVAPAIPRAPTNRISTPGAAVDHYASQPVGSPVARLTRRDGTSPNTAPMPSISRPPSVPTRRGPAIPPPMSSDFAAEPPTSPSPSTTMPAAILPLPAVTAPMPLPPLPPNLPSAPLPVDIYAFDVEPQRADSHVAPMVPAAALYAEAAHVQTRPASAVRSTHISDVTPRGLGIATVGGYCEELIRRNARLPIAYRKEFSTAFDMQRSVRIQVCQGESRRIQENLVLGDLVLNGIEPRPRGETSIEVTFSIDASGILSVAARDTRTGRSQHASLDILGAMAAPEVAAARARLEQRR